MKATIVLLVLVLTLVSSQITVEWKKCDNMKRPLRGWLQNQLPWINIYETSQKSSFSPAIDCASVPVPARWDNPGGKKIIYHLYRLKANSTRKGQLWLLNGGPGGDGESMARYFGEKSYNATKGEYDLIIPDHRGVGRSSRMSCPQEDDPNFNNEITSPDFPGAIWKACIEHMKSNYDPLAYTVTDAAHDIYHISRALKVHGEKTLLYGVSYGTYLGHRVLQMYPDAFDSMVFDGICPPEKCKIMNYDEVVNRNGIRFFTQCESDSTCRSLLGMPSTHLMDTIRREFFKPSHCLAIFSKIKDLSFAKKTISGILSHPDLRMLVIPLFKKMYRCNGNDVQSALKFLSVFGLVGQVQDKTGDSMLLAYNIMMSEMLFHSDPYSVEYLRRFHNETGVFSVFSSIGPMTLHYRGGWPKYPTDNYFNRYATLSKPLLLINGDLDHATPYDFAEHLARNIRLPPRNLVKIPNGAHALLYAGDYEECALHITVAFLTHGIIDDACVSKLPRMDWAGKTEKIRMHSKNFFGSENMWE